MRFDQMIRSGMTVRDVRTRFPNTAGVLEDFGFRPSCDDCSIEVVARKYGLSTRQVVDTLNEAAFGRPSEDGRQSFQ